MGKTYRLLLLGLLLIPCWGIAISYNVDLTSLYAALRFSHTQLSQVYAYRPNGVGRYFYGPFSLVFFYPLGALSYPVVKWIWIALQTLSFFAIWIYLEKLYPFIKSKSSPWWVFLIVWIVSINPIHNNFQSNNIQLLLATFLFSAEFFSRSEKRWHQWVSGILVAVAAGIKVFPLFIAALYLLRKPNAVRWGVISGLAIVLLLPFLFFHPTEGALLYQAFFKNLTVYTADNSLSKTHDILCLPSLLYRWLDLENGSAQVASLVVKGLTAILSLAFFYFAWKQPRSQSHSDRKEIHLWALALALMIVLNPSTRPHYFIFLVPAFCSLLEVLVTYRKNVFTILATVLSVSFVAFTAEGAVGKHWTNVLGLWNVPTIGMILLCGSLAYLISKKKWLASS